LLWDSPRGHCEFAPLRPRARRSSDRTKLRHLSTNPRNLLRVSSDSRYYFVHGDICDRDVVRGLLERYQRLQMIVIHSEAFEAFLRDFTLNPNDPMFRM